MPDFNKMLEEMPLPDEPKPLTVAEINELETKVLDSEEATWCYITDVEFMHLIADWRRMQSELEGILNSEH